jgi:hypothetical protein
MDGSVEVRIGEQERRAFRFDELLGHLTGVDGPRYCIVVVHPTRLALEPQLRQPAADGSARFPVPGWRRTARGGPSRDCGHR